MKSDFLHGCNCGLSDSDIEEPAPETKQDAVKEAKQYSNGEVPIAAKMVVLVLAILVIGKFTQD